MTHGRDWRGRWSDGRFYAATIDRLTAGVRGYVAERLPAGERVLDACCGTGSLARELARQGRDVVGIDLSPRHIRYARQQADADDLRSGRARFDVGDVTQLELPSDGPYDVAVTVLSLHEMPGETRRSALATLAAVARKVMVVDFTSPMPWNTAGLRNRAAELLAGPTHFRAFLDYSRNGGLAPLVDHETLDIESDRTIDAGTLHIVTATSATAHHGST